MLLSRPQKISIFCLKIKATITPDDATKVYTSIDFPIPAGITIQWRNIVMSPEIPVDLVMGARKNSLIHLRSL